ncbi:MAG: TatD family hydrolase, partial [Clostridiales bacterium]|nr:TatD family hydrolase [Clostridiales bacterium]
MLFDTHAHLNDPKLFSDLEAVLARAKQAKVEKIATVGYDWASSLMSLRLAEKYPERVYAAVGIHPHDAKNWNEELEEKLYHLAQQPGVVAWGEIGLDYYRDRSPRDIQRQVFKRQILLARELDKPLIIHNRDAHSDTLQILAEEKAGINGGILHCFSGSWETAKQCLSLGFHISFAGPVTYQNARNLGEIATKTPLDRLLVETDCPYLPPHPYRGQTN